VLRSKRWGDPGQSSPPPAAAPPFNSSPIPSHRSSCGMCFRGTGGLFTFRRPMLPKRKNERHVGFVGVDANAAQAAVALTSDTDQSDLPGRHAIQVFVRTPTLPTGLCGAAVQIHPVDPAAKIPGNPSSENDAENSSASGSGSPNDDFSNPRDRNGDGTISPTSSRSESPSSSPARKRDEDLAGLTSKQGEKFGGDGRDATLRKVGQEGDEADALEVSEPVLAMLCEGQS